MKTVATPVLLILVISMVFGGMTYNVFAQDDPAILLKIAKGFVVPLGQLHHFYR